MYLSIGECAALLEPAGFEIHQAYLFERPTLLEGEDGYRAWIGQFGAGVLDQVGPRREEVVELAESRAKQSLYRDGKWYADYRRLRMVAVRKIY
jgi:hypothetical protein